jgi:ornithine cyclodeaminase/alanine dehydrogenase-like protein (mu-crystallin family)
VRIISADDIDQTLSYPQLIDGLEAAFRAAIAVPPRQHHTISQDGSDATLLVMPAWDESADAAGERHLGCKLVSVFPDNATRGEPALAGSYLLMSGTTGAPLAVMEARRLTAWRTAAASALAARHLARDDASCLLMVGAGTLAPFLVRAHRAVRPITRVLLWNRTRSRAIATAFALANAAGIETEIADDLEAAVREADIVSCATLSPEPLIKGAWLKKGMHVDLVGGFTPRMREADDAAIKKARLYVDTRTALKEAGDLAQPIRRKAITAAKILGDLGQLCRGEVKGRRKADEITLFKSVGTAIEDLAAAKLVWAKLGGARA